MKCFFFYLYSAIVIDIIIIVNGMFKIFDYINNVFFVISISIFDVYYEYIFLCCYIMFFRNKEIFDFKLYVVMVIG